MNVQDIQASQHRSTTPGVQIAELFTSRWSPRAMNGQPVSQTQVNALVEAARWAPSCFNAQPWRFAAVLRDSDSWDSSFTTLLEGNQAWVNQAGALIAVISRREYEHNGKPAATHQFDAGAAWMSLALQAQAMGLVAHAMQGFDPERARAVFAVPDLYDLPAMIAIGYPGDIDSLPAHYQDKEVPSGRKPLAEILFTNNFRELDS